VTAIEVVVHVTNYRAIWRMYAPITRHGRLQSCTFLIPHLSGEFTLL